MGELLSEARLRGYGSGMNGESKKIRFITETVKNKDKEVFNAAHKTHNPL